MSRVLVLAMRLRGVVIDGLTQYTTYPEATLLAMLKDVSGEVLVVRDGVEGKYVLRKDTRDFTPCTFNIVARSDKPKRVSHTLEERNAILLDFIRTNRHVPAPTDKHMECSVGTHYKNLVEYNGMYGPIESALTAIGV